QAIDIVAPTMLEGMLGEYPDNMLGAKFNVPYAVAAAIVRDSVDVNSFYSEARGDKRIQELAGKVNVTTDPDLAAAREDGPLTQAFVRLKDGRVLEGDTTIVRGDYGNRLPREELLEKFHFLNDSILGSERANEVIDTIDGLERLSDVRELTALVGG
ncbi:MAG: MmgE/PrpD family protein, partial [Chloroflexi bacterium]|nr:MmgE/PrpD family protein [Chloroflexota bacterium]